MKLKTKILLPAFIALFATTGMVSCSDDDLGPSIFDTTDYPLDRSLYTFPLDTFVKTNFLEPYNLRYIYKMEDIGSDLQTNLVPASYDKSVKLAVLAKYLWYDVYKKYAGEEFLKIYSPRIIHVIGSPSYNPSSGTETLGEAEGGLKITLYNTNNLDENDIDLLNEKFFKTMHHEFSHILHQNYVYPTSFSLISNSLYNPMSWQDTNDSIAASQGFVSPYGSSQAREDWVEIIANYIVKDSITWNGLLNTAQYDWELVNMAAPRFNELLASGGNRDSIGYFQKIAVNASEPESRQEWSILRKIISRDANDNPIKDDNGNIVYIDENGIDGRSIILQKLDMAREWLMSNFNINIEDIRNEVQRRQWLTDADGKFVIGSDGKFVNRLVSPLASDPSVTLIDSLVNEVNAYKALQTTE